MNVVIKRPKMIIALALLAALVVDCIIGLCFNVRFMTLAAGTCIWVGIVIVLMFAVRVIVRLKDKHISFKKYNLAKPIRRVSAVIPNYNYARYLKERVDSIMSQTYPVYELIILDDASSDNSVEVINDIVEDLKLRYPSLKVKFIPNAKNSGNVFEQWRKCFEVSEGDFVWICEADDSCNKYFLNAVMRAFNDKEVVLSYAESRTIDEDGATLMPNLRSWIDEFRIGHWDESYVNDGIEELQDYLCVNNTIANVSGVVFRRINAPIVKYLKEARKYRLAGDWYFYAKYLLHGKIAYCSESLNYHRMHNKGVTLTTDKYKQYLEIEAVQKTIAKDVKLSTESKEKILKYHKVLVDSFGLSEEELKYMKTSFERILSKSGVSDKVLLSVIVSAYNAEKYIERSLASVVKALPEKSEIIVVDDGSSDGTLKRMKEFQKKNSSIMHCFHKKNGGLSSAKNYGLSKAGGRYVIFMDADDEIRMNGYSVMLKKALEKDADIVVCDMALVYEDGAVINNSVYHDKPGGLKGFLIDGLMASSNNKMVKKELYQRAGKYPEGFNNEDVAVTPLLMVLSKNTQYIPSSFYRYYQRSGSIQNSSFSKKRLRIFDTVIMANKKIKEVLPQEADDIFGIMVGNQLIALLVHVICNIEDSDKREHFIGAFIERYRNLGVVDNEYIDKYCAGFGLDRLPDYLLEATPGQVYSYIKRRNRIDRFKDYVGRALGIKKLILNR